MLKELKVLLPGATFKHVEGPVYAARYRGYWIPFFKGDPVEIAKTIKTAVKDLNAK